MSLDDGVQLKRWFSSFAEFRFFLRQLVRLQAVICLSPNRTERCDAPAIGIFFQDEAEWYPCCVAHWPTGPQWTGHTKYSSGYRVINLFVDKLSEVDAAIDIDWNDKTERYDRRQAT
jgi:hypothetical protein